MMLNNLFTFALMLAVALAIGQLAARDLCAAIETEQIVSVCSGTIAPLLGVHAALVLPDADDRLRIARDAWFVEKPFGVPELLARARAQLRRAAVVSTDGQASSIVRFGGVIVDLGKHEVARDGELVHLTRLEFRLLAALIRGRGGVIAARQLLAEVWGVHDADRAHYMQIYVTNLRQKLEETPATPRYLLTELQFGYRLVGLEAVGTAPYVV
ncbi:winged helix-turn-helix domain-containing protein [Burkholderia ubonensis]|uniref:winged helix-turn-helix domain-containing protein n=1 Tax=Burkholderia ubonensis TaxID=101571 RepID=UPI0039F60722